MAADTKENQALTVPDIVIAAMPEDEHVQAVYRYLQDKHKHIVVSLLDTSLFPQKVSCQAKINDQNTRVRFLQLGTAPVSLEKLKSIWWWRPQIPQIDRTIQDAGKAEFAYRACCHLLEGIWFVLDCLWLNQPEKQDLALNNMYQVALARNLGFHVPDTLVTNSPDAVLDFWNKHDGQVLYRQLLPFPKSFRLTREILKKIDSLKISPLMFQEIVALDAMLTVVVVGDAVFAARVLHNPKNGSDDALKKYALPRDVESKLLHLTRQMGLLYNKIDVGIDKNSNYVFFAVDPTFAFLPVEKQAGFHITELLAEILVRGKVR
jgi:hypothetical protein